jgi:hypothetical protein
MSSVNEWPTNEVWYEVLSVPRREVEETVYVKVTITDERGNVAVWGTATSPSRFPIRPQRQTS